MTEVIFLDGESKGGKTAVGSAISKRLNNDGMTTSTVVAGHFFRRLTLLALRLKPADNDTTDWLEDAVAQVIESSELYETEYDADELDSHEVDHLVSSVGQLGIAQQAVNKWRVVSADRAIRTGAEVVLLDGRNLRQMMADWVKRADIWVALELVIYCSPIEAARRYLADKGNKTPSQAEFERAESMIQRRRQQDRTRQEAPYVDPIDPVRLVAGHKNAATALEQAWTRWTRTGGEPPRPILFDNSEVPKDIGLSTVSELASLAVKRKI